jgi:D-methionine transport system substrate-binding protein
MKRLPLLAAAALLPFAAGAEDAPLKIGCPAGSFGDILGFAAEQAHTPGLEARKIEFTDWITPNEALAAGDINADLL